MGTPNPYAEESPSTSRMLAALQRTPQTSALTVLCALFLIAFSLACQLIAAGNATPLTAAPESLAQALVSDTRVVLGSRLYTQADVYFHRGVPHGASPPAQPDIFQRFSQQVTPQKPLHLAGATDIAEMMPWLDFSTRLNPQNLEGYLVSTFWLAGEARRPDLALNILANAQRNIPYSYAVQLEKGRILLHMGNHALAREAFHAALAFWDATAVPANADHVLDKGEALLYGALLLEAAGATPDAIADLEALSELPPERPAMQIRLQQLKDGKPTHPSARDLLDTMLRQHRTLKCTCEHEVHDAHEEQDHEEDRNRSNL